MASNQRVEFTDAGVKDKILRVDNFTTINDTYSYAESSSKRATKGTILGCNLFANGSGKDTTHWWHPKQTHVQTQLASNLQKLALKTKLSMYFNACDICPFARKERLAVHCYLVRHVSHHQEKGTH